MDSILSANQTNTSYKRNRRVYICGDVCWVDYSACTWNYDQRYAGECYFERVQVLGATFTLDVDHDEVHFGHSL